MRLRLAIAILMLALYAPAQKADLPAWFAPDASTSKNISDGLAEAQKLHRRLLVVYDGNWCTGGDQFQKALAADPSYESYVPVRVTTDDLAGVQKFAARLRAALKTGGGPLLTIVEGNGHLLAAAAPENARLKGLLAEWRLGATAEEVVAKALPNLDGKAGWVEFRADWCGWCHKMEKFFGESDAAPILRKYYTVITIDTEKNPGATELSKRLGSKSGTDSIPWFAVVDAEGKTLANSNAPTGNIGYPDTAPEKAHFFSVVSATAKGITPEEVEVLRKRLDAK